MLKYNVVWVLVDIEMEIGGEYLVEEVEDDERSSYSLIFE